MRDCRKSGGCVALFIALAPDLRQLFSSILLRAFLPSLEDFAVLGRRYQLVRYEGWLSSVPPQ